VLKALKGDEQINLKKADKGTNTVVMTKEDKLNEGQIQLDVREHYRPLESPMVEETPVGRPIISGCDGPTD